MSPADPNAKATKSAPASKNIGAGESFNVTIGAGLHEFLRRHALRAIIGKSAQDVAVHLMVQQAIAYDRESYLGVNLPTDAFPATPDTPEEAG